jgi:hypothetical protein
MVGYVHPAAQQNSDLFAAFREGLSLTGYVDARNVTIKFRSEEGQYHRLPEIAAEFVRRQLNVIAAGTSVAALAAKRATSSIPIAFARQRPDEGRAGRQSRFHKFWCQQEGRHTSGRRLRRAHSQGREASRPLSSTANQVRTPDQRQHGEGVGDHGEGSLLARAGEVIE